MFDVGVSEADELEKIGNCAEAKVQDLTRCENPSDTVDGQNPKQPPGMVKKP